MEDRESGTINAEQYTMLMRPLHPARVAKRSQGGKQLSYVEAWDIRAMLIRVFGFGNFDAEIVDSHLVYDRDYQNNDGKPMKEIAYFVKFRLRLRDELGRHIATYTEGAVGSFSGSSDFGGLHDNALKAGASDALKRCVLNLGTPFGLGLYDDGSLREVIRKTAVVPDGWTAPEPTEAAVAAVQESLGGQVTDVVPTNEPTEEVPA
jgi:recombination DNA repair RAD52 pathway protein